MNTTIIQCRLEGLRPLMFDRYAGDNSTQLPTEEKMYLAPSRHLILPAVNVFSLLCAENSKSVCRQFMGKAGKSIAMGISSYISIDPFEIPILDDKGPVRFDGWNGQIGIHHGVARLKPGIPNPKTRPVLSLPWHVDMAISYQENKYCTLDTLRQVVTVGGTLGLGTFRPFFGRYTLTKWEETQEA